MGEEGYLEIDIKQIAKQLLQNNETIIRSIGKEKLDNAFGNIHVLDTQAEFREESGGYSSSTDGFNRKDYICIGPDATPYTIIREVLQYTTSDFDQYGERTKNGIAQNQSIGQHLLNQGLLEYMATKISGESPTNQSNKKAIFSRLEPMMISYTGKEDMLLEALLNNQDTVHKFVEKFADRSAANTILNSITDSGVEQLEKSFKKMERKVNIQCIINKLKQKITMIFNKKEIKALPSPKVIEFPSTPREKFVKQYANSGGKKVITSPVRGTSAIKIMPTTLNREEETK